MLQEGQELAGYRLLRMIGEGGMGQVFLAEQLRLGRQVAVKLVRLDAKGDAPPGASSPAEELTREAQALMVLEHPHILPLYDAGREGNLAYLVMPYIPEGSLQEVLRPGPRQRLQLPLPPGEALIYLDQAASALQYAHDRGFIHRDVKPANFLVRLLSRSHAVHQVANRLHLFLADFGLSKFLAYSTNTTHLSGTPAYMAPEQFQGHASPASDQYSLAILFYYLLTGELPFRGSPVELMFKHLNEPPPAAHQRVDGLPEALARVIQRGMAKAPEERYPSIMGLAESARAALVDAGLVPSQDSFPVPAVPGFVRPPKKPQEQLMTSAAGAMPGQVESNRVPSAVPSPHELVTKKDIAEASTQMDSVRRNESSLPTLPLEEPRLPPEQPQRPEHGSKRLVSLHGRLLVQVSLVVVLLGALLSAGLFLWLGPGSKPAAQGTPPAPRIPSRTVPPSGTASSPASSSPTPVSASAVLESILGKSPIYTVDLDKGDAQWDSTAINPSIQNHIYTPTGILDILDTRATFLDTAATPVVAKRFPLPLAIAVELQAPANPQFDLLLDTIDGSGSHLYYRLRLVDGAPPEVAHSSDNRNYMTDGAGSGSSSVWNDHAKHSLVLVLDGKRLLFYIDRQPLLDILVVQPYAEATLTLASLGEAMITGINVYSVPNR